MTIDFNGTEITNTKQVYKNLCAKLHPNRIVGSSDKMYFIMSTILGQEWITRDSSYGSFEVQSDGGVIDNDLYVGNYESFIANIKGYIAAAELTDKQEAYFWQLFYMRVHDWRIPQSGSDSYWTLE